MFDDDYFRQAAAEDAALRQFKRAQAGGFRQKERGIAQAMGGQVGMRSPNPNPPTSPRGTDPTARNMDLLGTRKHR